MTVSNGDSGRATGAGRLPDGYSIALNRHVRERDGGRTLVGGTPTRVVYLAEEAVELISDGRLRVRDARSEVLGTNLLEAGMADPVLDDLPEVDASGVTFVIPVYDRPMGLQRLLASIGPRERVIVIDDASRDADAIAAVTATYRAELVRLPKNGGPAAARNEGLRRALTPFVAFVDSDVVLEPFAVATLLRHFSDPAVAMVAPRVVGARHGATTSWISRYEHARSSLDLGPHPSIVRPRAPVAWLPGACIVARVAALGDGFSPDMRVGEDVDLVWRLAARGWRIRYEPSVHVEHEHRDSVREWLRRKAFYGTAADRLTRDHGLDVAPAVLAPWSAAVVIALLAQRRWSVPAALAVTGAAALRVSAKLRQSRDPLRLSALLTLHGALAAMWQALGLMLRHWWPLSAASSLVSKRARRAVAIAMLVDSVVEYRRLSVRLDPVRFALARRLDDLAYGGGVWYGALRGRSVRALLPDIRRSR
jgi:mycofactocin glycosyltransferase